MLQWMGGSRRNVTTTRKSTLQRQKQYFEQRRRNLQREGNSNQGVKTREDQYKAHQSLDILNLQALSNLAQQQKSSNLKVKEDGGIVASTASRDFTKDPPIISVSVTGLTNSSNSKKAEEDSTEYHLETSPKKVLSGSLNHLKNKDTIERPNLNTAFSEQQLSIFDLLDDDQPKDNLQGQSTLEAHVAFSVEGLGKVGTETPVHSPQRAQRNPYGCSSLFKYAKEKKGKKLNYILDEFVLEVDDRMQNAGIPVMDNSLDFPMETGSYSKLKQNPKSAEQCIHFNDYSANIPYSSTINKIIYKHGKEQNLGTSGDYLFFNDFNTDDIHGSSFRNRNFYEHQNVDEVWNGESISILDENLPNERAFHVAWKNKAALVDDRPTDFLVNDSHNIASYAFNRQSRKRRALEPDMADILELPASRSKKKISDWFDSSISQGAGNFDVQDPTGQPHYFAGVPEDVRDNSSALSEESCSSTAVCVNITKNLPAKLPTEDRRRKHGTGRAGSGNYYDCIGGKCLCSNPPKRKPSHNSIKILEDLGAHDSWQHEQEYSSTSFDLSDQNPKVELPRCKNKIEDELGGFRIPTSHTKVKPLSEGVLDSTSILDSPFWSFSSEKFVFHDSPECSTAELVPTRCQLSPDLNLKSSPRDVGVSEFVTKSINLAEQENVSKLEIRRKSQQTNNEVFSAKDERVDASHFAKSGSPNSIGRLATTCCEGNMEEERDFSAKLQNIEDESKHVMS